MSKGFSVKKGLYGRFKTHILTNDDTGESATVIDDFGAQLQSLRFLGPNGQIKEVIMGHPTPEEMIKSPYMAGTVPLIPFANYITGGQYHFMGEEYQLEIVKTRWAPKGLAMHGFLYDKPWTLMGASANKRESSVTYMYNISENEFKGYPFHLNLLHELKLSEEFTSRLVARNDGERPLPLALGFHPYMQLSDSSDEKIDGWELSIPSSKMLVKDNANPTGFLVKDVTGTPYDFTKPRLIGNARFSDILWLFETHGKASSRLLKLQTGFGIDLCLGSGYKYLLFYTPSSRKGLAIEPMCGVPDSFNNGIGLTTLKSGQQYTATYVIRPSHVEP